MGSLADELVCMAKSRRTTTHVAIMFLVLTGVLFSCAAAAAASTVAKPGCMEVERDALLSFKAGIIRDPSQSLSSWSIHGEDCCSWSGVLCSNSTGTASAHVHVVELNLAGATLSAEKLSPSILSLTHLELLNLAFNDFGGIPIPKFLGSFQKLRSLDLASANFSGAIPPQLGNLSTLTHLSLSTGSYGQIRVDNLDWLLGLPSLTFLDMTLVNLSKASHNWLPVVSTCPSLRELNLSACGLDSLPSSFSHPNLTALTFLDLSFNSFNSTLPSWLWQLTSLSYLDLRFNHFHGVIASAIGNLARLRYLGLSYNLLLGPLPAEFSKLTQLEILYMDNNYLLGGPPLMEIIGNLTTLSILSFYNCSLTGPIQADIGNLTSLTELVLGSNLLSGPIPIEMSKLYKLYKLDLSFNLLHGNIFESHFANMTGLLNLNMSGNSLLNIAVDHDWLPPFQLDTISLDSCKLNTSTFPTWLRSQKSIILLSLSNTSIEDSLMPNHWFWKSYSSTISYINLSHNKISGSLPTSLVDIMNLFSLNLGYNLFQGIIPLLPPQLNFLDLSNNLFSGPLPPTLGTPKIYHLLLSNNHIEGGIPSSLCNFKSIEVIDLSNNKLSGKIPNQCWHKARRLRSILLGNNKLMGRIPSSIGSLTILRSLHLNNNNLSGYLPSSLQNCSSLKFIDFGENKLSGNIPTWMGISFQKLTILRLRSNIFSGNIPLQFGHLSNLQIIDLANNRLSGPLPYTFGNLNALISVSNSSVEDKEYYSLGGIEYETIGYIQTVTKGREYNLSTIVLSLAKIIDLSSNSLTGTIPIELGSLARLQTLNLSRNNFNGEIPKTINGMRSLETLDLSFNKLEGVIPQGLAALNSLGHLNLSHNNLSGSIPTGNQLQTLDDASIYIGNTYLCGALLNKSCFSDKNITMSMNEAESPLLSVHWSAIIGFLVGLWSVFIVLLFKKAWRYLYFHMIDKLYDEVYGALKCLDNQ